MPCNFLPSRQANSQSQSGTKVEECNDSDESRQPDIESQSGTNAAEWDSSDGLLTAPPDSWELEDVRRHWTLLSHCNAQIFPNMYPALTFSTELATILWHYQRLSARPSQAVIRQMARCAGDTLRKITLLNAQVEQFILCDVLFNVEWLDFALRKSFLENVCKYLSLQTGLITANFEHAQLKRKEGMRALMALGEGSAKTLKRLYMWRMFHQDENPVLLDTTFCKYRDKGAFRASSTCKRSFWRTLVRFYHLTTLAIDYSFLADLHGHTLCVVASVLVGRLRELKLLCLEHESPHTHKANDFDGRFKIPDSSWQVALNYCPKMKVHMVFVAISLYEQVTAFLSQSIPLSKIYISSGIELGETVRELHVDCTMKTLINWYSNSLETLHIHLWRNQDLLDSILLRALDGLPILSMFAFSGVLYRGDTIEKICLRIRDGCLPALKMVRIRMQTVREPACHLEFFPEVQARLIRDIDTLGRKYRDVFKERGIRMDLGIYPI